MENYIVINGKKAELTPEQLKALGIEVEKDSLFKRIEKGETYYSITSYGMILPQLEIDTPLNKKQYNSASYCTDKNLLQQQAYRETLNRLLWRFSMENGWSDEGWKIDEGKFCIVYDHDNKAWNVIWAIFKHTLNAVYFKSEDIAIRAIKEIVKPFMEAHPDFKL